MDGIKETEIPTQASLKGNLQVTRQGKDWDDLFSKPKSQPVQTGERRDRGLLSGQPKEKETVVIDG